jgi:hypothetical protein
MSKEKLFESDDGTLYRNSPLRPIRENYSRHYQVIENTHQMRASLRAGPYGPGGYNLCFVTSDGAALCYTCARSEYRQISQSIRNRSNDGWRVVALDINYEDNDCMCANCNADIQPAYTERQP